MIQKEKFFFLSILALNTLYCLYMVVLDQFITEYDIFLIDFIRLIFIISILVNIILIYSFLRKTIISPSNELVGAKKWTIFEKTILILGGTLGILALLKNNTLNILINLQIISDYLNSGNFWTICIDLLVRVEIFLLIIYLAIKLPQMTRILQLTLTKFYINGIRIHESFIGLAFLVFGGILIIFGFWTDSILGLIYALIGGFFIGRDYNDVALGKFIYRESLDENVEK